MSKDSNGFYKRRRGIVDHLEAGTIDLLDLAIHDYLNLKANLVIGNGFPWPAGIVFTSAVAVASYSDVDERTIRRRFDKLESLGWIKTWQVPGKHGNYPVLIVRASVHDMSGNEYRVNGLATTDWRNPVYDDVRDVSVTCPGGVREVSGLREVENRELRKEKKHLPPAKPAGASVEFQIFYDAYPRKLDRKEAIRAWIKGGCDGSLGEILAGLDSWKKCAQWLDTDKIPYPATWINKQRWKETPMPAISKAEQKARNTDAAIERFKQRLNSEMDQPLKQTFRN